MKTLLASLVLFLLLCGTIALGAYMYLTEQSPKEMTRTLYTHGRFLLYDQGMVKKLSQTEIKKLYRTTCTRRCHSRDVIEKKPRTALEWDWIVTRMKSREEANIADRRAALITRYLQENYLSNMPTIMPERTMRFVKKHLWKSDFGESDLYLDIIYLPELHLRLLPYLVASNSPPKIKGAVFIVFVNTHQGVIPPWDLSELAVIKKAGEKQQNSTGWELIYEDGQGHHKQGVLTFPAVNEERLKGMEIVVRLPGMKPRRYIWDLPVPEFEAGGESVVKF